MSNLPLYRIITSFDEALFWMDQSLAFFESSKVLDNSPSEYTSMPIITNVVPLIRPLNSVL